MMGVFPTHPRSEINRTLVPGQTAVEPFLPHAVAVKRFVGLACLSEGWGEDLELLEPLLDSSVHLPHLTIFITDGSQQLTRDLLQIRRSIEQEQHTQTMLHTLERCIGLNISSLLEEIKQSHALFIHQFPTKVHGCGTHGVSSYADGSQVADVAQQIGGIHNCHAHIVPFPIALEKQSGSGTQSFLPLLWRPFPEHFLMTTHFGVEQMLDIMHQGGTPSMALVKHIGEGRIKTSQSWTHGKGIAGPRSFSGN